MKSLEKNARPLGRALLVGSGRFGVFYGSGGHSGQRYRATLEFGFSFLQKIQAFTGAGAGLPELQLIHQLYRLRKQHAGATGIQTVLDRASALLSGVQVTPARRIIDSVAGLTALASPHASAILHLTPNSAIDRVQIDLPAGFRPERWVLLDGLGRAVLSGKEGKEISVGMLPPGLYRIQVHVGARIYSSTLMKE